MTDATAFQRPLGGTRLGFRTRFAVWPAQGSAASETYAEVERIVGGALADARVCAEAGEGGWRARLHMADVFGGGCVRLAIALREGEEAIDVAMAALSQAAPAALEADAAAAVRMGSRVAAAILAACAGRAAWLGSVPEEFCSPCARVTPVTLGSMQELFDALSAPRRIMPLAIVSSLSDGTWPVHPDELAAILAGMAHVFAYDASDEAMRRATALLPGAGELVPQPGGLVLSAPPALAQPLARYRANSSAQAPQSFMLAAVQAGAWADAMLSRVASDPCMALVGDDSQWGGEA